MVKTLSCSKGHCWQVDDRAVAEHPLPELTCPVCGAGAETVADASGEHDTNHGQPPPAEDAFTASGHRLLGEAGRGGMGVVYRAVDRRGRKVALKTLQRIDPVALHRFKTEFRSLSDISHRNLVSLYELISDGDTWCFTMELVEGVDVLQYVRHGAVALGADQTVALDVAATEGPAREGLSAEQVQRLESVLAQLAEGVMALHAAQILHRDIKPSNVMVDGEGRVVLLDFGLAAALDSRQMHSNTQDKILGTVAYMSPEQAASETVSHASDWYSLGCLMYEALTGRPPFTGRALRVLQAKQQEDPPPPSDYWPDVPPGLKELCLGLLHRDPTRRATGRDVLRRVRPEGPEPESPSPRDAGGPLIGREPQLETLRAAYAEVRAGRPANVLIRGVSGSGKSSLVEHLLGEVQLADPTVVVLAGRCYERESVPFKAIDGLVDSLAQHLRKLPEGDAEALMPRDVQALVRLFPVMGQVKAANRTPRRKNEALDPQELNRRAVAALRETLARLGDRCPLVVYIDDLQWGDEDSAAMLLDLLQAPDAPLLLFIGTYRSEDAEASPLMRAWRQLRLQRAASFTASELEVGPLSRADSIRLALALLDRDDAAARQAAEAIAAEAAGNPFYVSELVNQLRAGLVSGQRPSPPALTEILWERVRRLPDDSQRLLGVVSLWGQPMAMELAVQLADVGQSAFGPLRTGHLVRTTGAGAAPSIETYHDRVREAVTEHLDAPSRRRHHLLIAEHLASQAGVDAEGVLQRLAENIAEQRDVDGLRVDSLWYDMAFHFDAAGCPQRAFPFALAAARQSQRQFSLEIAEQQYRIADRGSGGQDEVILPRLAEGLGDVLMLRGKYPEAAEQFQRASQLVSSRAEEQARIEGKLGELAFKRGDNQASAAAIERSLQLLGQRVPQGRAGFAAALAWQVMVQTAHTLLPRRVGRKADLSGREQLAVRLWTKLAYAYFFDRGKVPCLWSHLKAINVAERYRPSRELGHVYATHAPVMSLLPWVRRGEQFARRSLEIRRQLDDVWGQGQSWHYLGIVLFVGARYDECLDACRRAVGLLEQRGDYWEVNVARYQIGNALYRQGQLEDAVEEAARLYEAAREMGDDKASGFALDVWSRGAGGDLPEEIMRREVERPRHDVQATAQVLLAEAVRLLAAGRLDEAEKTLLKADHGCRAVGMRNAWVAPVLPWLATVRRRQLSAVAVPLRDERRRLLRAAVHRATAMANKFRTDLPHATREAAAWAALRGKPARARKLIDLSLAVARQQGAQLEHALSLLARGQMGTDFSWPEASRDLSDGLAALRALGAVELYERIEGRPLE